METNLMQLDELFHLENQDLRSYSPLTLAYIGDGVAVLPRDGGTARGGPDIRHQLEVGGPFLNQQAALSVDDPYMQH